MNDFDRMLEFELRQMLDRVVATRVPARRDGRKQKSAPFLVVVPAQLELAPEAIAVVDSMPAQPAAFLS
jgi:hypothetical protein